MINPPKREELPHDRAAVVAMIRRLHALKAQRLADEAAGQSAEERSPPPRSSAVTAAPSPPEAQDVSIHPRGPDANELEPAAHQLGLLDL